MISSAVNASSEQLLLQEPEEHGRRGKLRHYPGSPPGNFPDVADSFCSGVVNNVFVQISLSF